MKNKILITGTVAFDDIETPSGNSGKVIGGAGTYIALASSLFTKNLAIVSIIGEDFPDKEIEFFKYIEVVAERTGAHIQIGDIFSRNIDFPDKIENHEVFKYIENNFMENQIST